MQVGLSLPLSKKTYYARENAAKKEVEIQQMEVDAIQTDLQNLQKEILIELNAGEKNIQYFESTALPMYHLILENATRSLAQGEIEFDAYSKAIDSAMKIRMDYLQIRYDYNQNLIRLKYLLN